MKTFRLSSDLREGVYLPHRISDDDGKTIAAFQHGEDALRFVHTVPFLFGGLDAVPSECRYLFLKETL